MTGARWRRAARSPGRAIFVALARHRSAEVDASYAAYDKHSLDNPDEWGDRASWSAGGWKFVSALPLAERCDGVRWPRSAAVDVESAPARLPASRAPANTLAVANLLACWQDLSGDRHRRDRHLQGHTMPEIGYATVKLGTCMSKPSAHCAPPEPGRTCARLPPATPPSRRPGQGLARHQASITRDRRSRCPAATGRIELTAGNPVGPYENQIISRRSLFDSLGRKGISAESPHTSYRRRARSQVARIHKPGNTTRSDRTDNDQDTIMRKVALLAPRYSK